jgi:hypothetical protein
VRMRGRERAGEQEGREAEEGERNKLCLRGRAVSADATLPLVCVHADASVYF